MTFRPGSSPLLRRGGVAFFAAVSTLGATASIAGAATATDMTQFSVTAGALAFSTAPALPTPLAGITLNGAAQTTNNTMTNIGVADATGAAAGWNVTVVGNTAALKSPVFAAYCIGPAVCGVDVMGYVPAGDALPANSLNLNSTGAGFTAGSGTTGIAPTQQCNSGVCPIDAGSATKVISAALGGGMGTYTTNGYSATSLALATPSTLEALPTNEVYRADVVWTLTSGP